ncbi:hypothetical protein [Aquabacterium sp. UBA2148]|uniref:hypothetical protein n=1 Tax=Aquabacterium sp. UBA2148 TaxID=1946042 RepID=UPI00257F7551|nr:hypothetical protein [Aquabacterium sp. UBA2148]
MPHVFTNSIHARLIAALVCCMALGQGRAASVPAVPALNEPGAAASWPRIFYQAEERADIELRRRAEEGGATPAAAALPLVYRLEGLAHGRKGASAWINGQVLRQGESHASGRTVFIGQGIVRLRLAGEPDIVLRPGQQAAETGELLQDVVPAGTFRKVKP